MRVARVLFTGEPSDFFTSQQVYYQQFSEQISAVKANKRTKLSENLEKKHNLLLIMISRKKYGNAIELSVIQLQFLV